MNTQQIKSYFAAFNDLNVLIIGDVMVDAYLWGHVDRISPEAPVPIVAVRQKDNRMGGAANVALNVKAMGATPILCAVIGQDEKGVTFRQLMDAEGLSVAGLVESTDRVTTVKTRIIGSSQQMMRVDEEDQHPLTEAEETNLTALIANLLDQEKVDVIIFEDYDKGVITPGLIKSVVDLAAKKNIPIAVDPKKRNFDAYKGVTLFKPNFKELKEGTKTDPDLNDMKEVAAALQLLVSNLEARMALVTLSERGVMIGDAQSQAHFPAHVRTIADVSGAGDTVISVAALCMALGLDRGTIAQWSNLAGGLVCESVGVVPIDKDRLLLEALALSISSD